MTDNPVLEIINMQLETQAQLRNLKMIMAAREKEQGRDDTYWTMDKEARSLELQIKKLQERIGES